MRSEKHGFFFKMSYALFWGNGAISYDRPIMGSEQSHTLVRGVVNKVKRWLWCVRRELAARMRTLRRRREEELIHREELPVRAEEMEARLWRKLDDFRRRLVLQDARDFDALRRRVAVLRYTIP